MASSSAERDHCVSSVNNLDLDIKKRQDYADHLMQQVYQPFSDALNRPYRGSEDNKISVFVWRRSTDNKYGHATLRTYGKNGKKTAIYASFWPANFNKLQQLTGTSSAFEQSIVQDMKNEEDQPPTDTIHLYQLDKKAIENAFNEFKVKNPSWSALGSTLTESDRNKNCCALVLHLLKCGGAAKLAMKGKKRPGGLLGLMFEFVKKQTGTDGFDVWLRQRFAVTPDSVAEFAIYLRECEKNIEWRQEYKELQKDVQKVTKEMDKWRKDNMPEIQRAIQTGKSDYEMIKHDAETMTRTKYMDKYSTYGETGVFIWGLHSKEKAQGRENMKRDVKEMEKDAL